MDVVAILIESFAAALVLAVMVFLVAYARDKRFDLIDAAWGLFFIAIVSTGVMAHETVTTAQYIVAAVVAIWGIRLAYHVFVRWVHASSEDPRYVALRAQWPRRARSLQMFVRVYMVQALLATIIALPATVMIYAHASLTTHPLFWLGLTVWAGGLLYEATADWQLSNFLAHHHEPGALMTRGLWRYSRHPNYFGEITLWWGLAIASCATGYGWLGAIGAVTITLLIRFVSGVPPTEKRAASKPGWQQYARHTSMLMPLPRR